MTTWTIRWSRSLRAAATPTGIPIKVAKSAEMQNSIAVGKKKVEDMEKGLLKADNPSLGAAVLQEAIKKIASKKRIQIRSESVLTVEEAAEYIKVPVQFQLEADLTQLTRLLYEIQSSPLLMGVRTMRINGQSRRNQGLLHVTLVVDGAIKKSGY